MSRQRSGRAYSSGNGEKNRGILETRDILPTLLKQDVLVLWIWEGGVCAHTLSLARSFTFMEFSSCKFAPSMFLNESEVYHLLLSLESKDPERIEMNFTSVPPRTD